MPTQDEQLKRAGLKVTLPRLKVMQVLEDADPHHLSAEEMVREGLAIAADICIYTNHNQVIELVE